MSQKSPDYMPFIKTLSFALKQYRLYSENHPITKETINKLDDELEHYFSFKEKMTLGAMRDRLLVDGTAVDEKESAAHDLAKDFDRLGIEGIILEKGLTVQEVSGMVSLMAMRAKMLQDKGGFKTAFEALKLSHIRLSHGKFQLVEEGEAVTSASAAEEEHDTDRKTDEAAGSGGKGPGAGPGGGAPQGRPVTSIVDIIQRIREGSPDVMSPGGGMAMDAEKITTQIEKSPKDFVEAALQNVEDEVRLEHVIRQTVRLLVEGLMSFLVEQGKDMTRALERLAKELEKGLKNIDGGPEIDKLRQKIPVIFEEATDELRVQMLKKTYEQSPEDLKRLEKLAKKIFKDKEVRDRLKPSLMEELGHSGLKASELEQMFQRMEMQAETKKKKISLDAEELEELRKKAEAYDAGDVSSEVEKKIKNLEIENKVIRHQKQRMDSVIRNLAEGLLIVDEEGKVVLMNPAAEKLLSVNPGEKVGKPVTEGLGDQHVVSMASDNLRDRGSALPEQHVQLTGTSEETKRILRTSTAVIENEDGQTVGMVSVLTDVTKQKELEELKDKFVANVSHELRTPLVAIQKSLSVILNKEVGDVTPDQQKFLSIAHRNIERLSRLINDLLDISRLESGQMSLKPSRFPVHGLIQHVISTVETWAKDKKITINIHMEPQEIEIEADPDRLTQVITNLLGNAIKFTPDGGLIKIEARGNIEDPEIPGGLALEVAVVDSGIGISPEDQKRIFEKFVQVGLTQPAGVSSSGLGLTITREIVELHSGKIWLESDGKNGSRFIFRVPVEFKMTQKMRR